MQYLERFVFDFEFLPVYLRSHLLFKKVAQRNCFAGRAISQCDSRRVWTYEVVQKLFHYKCGDRIKAFWALFSIFLLIPHESYRSRLLCAGRVNAGSVVDSRTPHRKGKPAQLGCTINLKHTFDFCVIESSQPHESTNTLTSSASLECRVGGRECFKVLIVESDAMVSYHKSDYLSLKPIGIGENTTSLPQYLDFDPVVCRFRILYSLNRVDDPLKKRKQRFTYRQLNISHSTSDVRIHIEFLDRRREL